jgi:glycosyltransferase involved in cell wall biosynthesis
MPKKILLTITKSNFGGAQRYVLDLASEYKSKGYDVAVAMGGDGILFDKIKALGITTYSVPLFNKEVSLPLQNTITEIYFLYKIIRKERPDVLHSNSSRAGMWMVAGRLARVPRIIFTLHGLAYNGPKWIAPKFFLQFVYWLTILFSHKTIAVSEALKKQVTQGLSILKNKIIVVHNGIKPPSLLTRAESRALLLELIEKERGETTLQIASLSIGTIGELNPVKGYDYLLEGFKKAVNESALVLYLYIIGEGEDKARLQKKITELELERRVFLCGHIDYAPKVLKAFDMFILPSISEGLPYVILESGAASLPTIASNVGGIPEIIQDSETGIIVEPKSPDDIADAIITLIFDLNMRRTLGSNLQKRIESEFSLDKMIKETEIVYNK